MLTLKPMRSYLLSIFTLIIIAIPVSAQWGQVDYESIFNGVEPSYEYTYEEVMIPGGRQDPGPDGEPVKLLVRIYKPVGEGPFPVVSTRTPYIYSGVSKENPKGLGDFNPLAREYARRGFVYVQQDCRGKGGSEGFYKPNIYEREDGKALYDWMAEQPWCGDIGIFGESYTALTGWIVADILPDKVKGLYLQHYGVDRHISCYRAGLFRQDIMSGWTIDNAEEDIIRPKRQPGQGAGEAYYDFYLYRPQVTADEAVLGQGLQYYRDWITHTDYTDPYWNEGVWGDLKRIPAEVEIPVTIIAGQFDHHEEGTLLGYERLNDETKKKSRLILGSWNHSSRPTPTHVPYEHSADFVMNSDKFEWFYNLLVKKEEPKGEVKVYNIEADEWLELDTWPIETSSNKKLYLSEDKTLTEKRPSKATAEYDYDPMDPVYAIGGETMFTSSGRTGSRQQPEAGYRDDVLSFVSEPLEEDMSIAGAIKLFLTMSTDVDDTAFAFTLSEITPDGKTWNMRTSITTLGYRHDLLGPREVYVPNTKETIEIVAIPIVWTVKAGNRLRIDVKSSNFPEYAVHSNFAGVWSEQGRTRVAHQTIYLGGEEGSYLEFPLLD